MNDFCNSAGSFHLKRAQILLTLCCFSVILLSACNAKKGLPPEEVLRRAILRSHTIDSASLSASINVLIDGGKVFSGSSVIQAVLDNGGTAWSATSTFKAVGLALQSQETSGRITLLTPDGQQFFLRTESLQGLIANLVKKTLTGSLNGWWVFGTSQSGQTIRTIRTAPSPAQLETSASMFRIINSFPPRRGQDGRLEYRLDVELDEKTKIELFPPNTTENTVAKGALFIDAQDFTLRRSTWDIDPLQTALGATSIHFDVTLQDFDRASGIKLPSGSSATLPLKDFFATFSF